MMNRVKKRVRAVLITENGALVTIKRIRPGSRTPYWILPGGGVEPGDRSPEAALHREVREELAGAIEIAALVQVVVYAGDQQHIYVARLGPYDFAKRTGPEFNDPERGEHIPEEVPFTAAGLSRINLVPPETAAMLRQLAATGTDPFTLPDLRGGQHTAAARPRG
jgi:8-oxo-dGTP pyrophosphatase MutT (NUDIX family)